MSHNVDYSKTLRTLSLCTGYGGIEIGLSRIGVHCKPVAYVEIEAYAVENLASKIEARQMDPAPIWSDVTTFDFERFRGCVDFIVGGYPCQPFAKCGRRDGANDERHLWPYIANGIRILRPRLVFFENVEGHVSMGLRDVLSDLAGMDYRTTFGLFSAAECGAPHIRQRVFVLGNADGARLEGWNGGNVSQRLRERFARSSNSWPARRGQNQFKWKRPRKTVGGLGRTVDGRSDELDRIDRLRLLGNGVVPDVAALAFVTLYNELLEYESLNRELSRDRRD